MEKYLLSYVYNGMFDL